MAKLIRQSRLARNNKVLSTFVERFAEYKEAKTAYDSAYAKLKTEAQVILKFYVPLKNAVSNRNWNRKYIKGIKIANAGKMVELTLSEGLDDVTYWKFPSWMIGSTTERIVEGLKLIIEEDGKRFAEQEKKEAQFRADRIRELELAKLEELKKKYEGAE